MKLLLVLCSLVGLVLMGAACSAAPTLSPTSAPPVSAQPAQTELIQAAQKEGALRIYTTLDETDFQPLLLRFGQRYPFLNVEYYHGSSTDLVQKLMMEATSASAPPDVVELGGVEMLQVYNAKLLTPYKSREAESYPDAAKHPWGYYSAAYVNAIAIAYNTNLVKAEEAPKTFAEITNPKWAGKMVIEPEDWALIPFSARIMGNDPSNQYWNQLAALKPTIVKGHAEIANVIASGAAAISPTSDVRTVELLKRKGAAINWIKTDPVYAYLQAVAITAKAPHPNAARLFIDWILSAAGQAELGSMGHIPVRSGVKPNPPTLTEGVRFYYGDPMLIGNVDDSRVQYYKLFGVR